jgi:hypothetical protein
MWTLDTVGTALSIEGAMIAFLDESGTHAGSRVTAMAGYLIKPDALPVLENQWSSTLREFQLDELHMREFVPPHGKYSEWDEERRRTLLEQLILIIHQHSSVGVGAAVEMTEFVATTHEFAHSKAPDLVQSPYEWCFRYCSVQAAAWADASNCHGLIDYVLDGGCSCRGRLHQSFRMSTENNELRQRFRLGTISFATGKEAVALQCADLLAYEMYKEADRLIREAPRPPRGSFLALFRGQDRLVTIKQDSMKREVTRGMQVLMAMLGHLPEAEKFQVMCYALRHMIPEKREILFEMIPSMRNVYSACLAKGELGKRLDELPRELLPPDDPKWFESHGVKLGESPNED